MTIKWNWTNQIAGFLVLNVTIAFFGNQALAQTIVPDNTLGEERSNVTPNIKINGVESDRSWLPYLRRAFFLN